MEHTEPLPCLSELSIKSLKSFLLININSITLLSNTFHKLSRGTLNPKFQRLLSKSELPKLVIELSRLHGLTRGIQFLGNITVKNEQGQSIIWSLCYPDYILQMLSLQNNVTESISFLMFNCINKENAALLCSAEGISIISKLLFELTKDICGDFCQLFLVRILLDFRGACCLYDTFMREENDGLLLLLLDFLYQTNEYSILSMSETNHIQVCSNFCKILPDQLLLLIPNITEIVFALQSSSVLTNLVLNTRGELCKSILAVLSLFSGFDQLLHLIQSNFKLFEGVVEILDILSGRPNFEDKIFKCSRKLLPLNTKDISEGYNLLFGMKQNVMKLISNCLHNNSLALDHLYKNSRIFLLIINQCLVDDLNPYLMQWTVLAIRNICQDERLQKLFISLQKGGKVENELAKSISLSDKDQGRNPIVNT